MPFVKNDNSLTVQDNNNNQQYQSTDSQDIHKQFQKYSNTTKEILNTEDEEDECKSNFPHFANKNKNKKKFLKPTGYHEEYCSKLEHEKQNYSDYRERKNSQDSSKNNNNIPKKSPREPIELNPVQTTHSLEPFYYDNITDSHNLNEKINQNTVQYNNKNDLSEINKKIQQDQSKTYLIEQQQEFELSEDGTEMFRDLVQALPKVYFQSDWHLIYSPNKHGYSYNEFLRRNNNLGPHIILIKDTNKIVFGAFVTNQWEVKRQCFGHGECMLFTFKRGEIMSWQWSGSEEDQKFQYCSPEGLYIGMGDRIGLYIKSDFYTGSTSKCSTFDNQPLTIKENFVIMDLEIWGFQPYDNNKRFSAFNQENVF